MAENENEETPVGFEENTELEEVSDSPEMEVTSEKVGEPITDAFLDKKTETSDELEETEVDKTTEEYIEEVQPTEEPEEDDKNDVMDPNFQKKVPYTFIKASSVQEIREAGKEAGKLIGDKNALVIEAKESADSFKAKITALNDQINYKYQIFVAGGLETTEECLMKYDHKNEDAIYFFEGKKVGRRDMHDSEREQLTLG